MSSPITAAFDTYELLERVLANLPIRDLLVCQRTSNAWQASILHSIIIRKKMFLVADGDVVHPVPVLRFNPALGFYRNGIRHHRGASDWRGRPTSANHEIFASDKHLVIGMGIQPAYNNGYPDDIPIAVQQYDPRLNLKGQVCTTRNLEGATFRDLHDARQPFAKEDEVKSGEPYDSRGSGMAICVVLPLHDDGLHLVSKDCRNHADEERLCKMPSPTYLYKILDTPPPSPLPDSLPTTVLDAKDGFIHLSTAQQTPITAKLFFAHCEKLWVLRLKREALDGKIEYSTDTNAGIRDGCAHLHESRKGLGRDNVEEVLDVVREGAASWEEAKVMLRLQE
ncbi:hypothetical protein LTR85_011751 [Meristemomyces frigidus]|nr:hypothetical protein LTR85_011751 [Meristemomyces frigidus]